MKALYLTIFTSMLACKPPLKQGYSAKVSPNNGCFSNPFAKYFDDSSAVRAKVITKDNQHLDLPVVAEGSLTINTADTIEGHYNISYVGTIAANQNTFPPLFEYEEVIFKNLYEQTDVSFKTPAISIVDHPDGGLKYQIRLTLSPKRAIQTKNLGL